jgi:VanZ like family/Concanavalin A-like lectin/glucanases superfamily
MARLQSLDEPEKSNWKPAGGRSRRWSVESNGASVHDRPNVDLKNRAMGAPSRAFLVKIVSVMCLAILCGILTAGLWPFHAPLNGATWIPHGNGIDFGHYGTAVSAGAFQRSGVESKSFCSIELSLKPQPLDDTSTILAFWKPDKRIGLSVHQYDGDLAFQRSGMVIHLPDALSNRLPTLVAIASGRQGTRVYVDGRLAGTVPRFWISSRDCSGRLVLGTSPVVNKSWAGQLRELAIYDRELGAGEASRHYGEWIATGRFDVQSDRRTVALYLFDEHGGRLVHDSSGAKNDLSIPERYLIVDEKFLEPTWSEFHNDWGYWKNVLINIGGFIPLGFVFYARLTMARRVALPALIAVALGACVSVTIEVLQAYLPSRDSGTTDIITNTLGTILGVALCRWNTAAMIFYRTLRAMIDGTRAGFFSVASAMRPRERARVRA